MIFEPNPKGDFPIHRGGWSLQKTIAQALALGHWNWQKHCFPKMPLGLTKKQDFSNFRGLLGRSERSLSLAAPQGNAARLCDRSAHPLRGAALRATLYAKGHSEMFLLLLPSLALLVFSCPFCTISHSPSLQCVPLPLHCDWPNIILNPHKWGALVESRWGLCNLCAFPSHQQCNGFWSKNPKGRSPIHRGGWSL